jgi:curved DNA-binding protein CbpA
MNYYLILGVPADADDDKIRSAYKALARQYHPDAGEGSSSERFRLIVEAYATLSDPARRRAYDRTLSPAPTTPAAVPVEPMVGSSGPRWTNSAPPHAMAGPAAWMAWSPEDPLERLWRALDEEFLPGALPLLWWFR